MWKRRLHWFLNRIINRLQEIKLNIGKFSISGLTLGAIIIILVVIGFVLRIVLHRKHYHKEPIFKKSNKCLKCGAEIERDKSFCPECGEKISKGKKSITVCSKCGETLRSNVNYCHKCGGKAKKIRI